MNTVLRDTRDAALCLSPGAERFLRKELRELSGYEPHIYSKVMGLLGNVTEEYKTADGATLRVWKDYEFYLADPGEYWLIRGMASHCDELYLFIFNGTALDYYEVQGRYFDNPFGLTAVRSITYTAA